MLFKSTQTKDGTAAGVAKVRYIESLHPPGQRLFHDPFAYAMYHGSIVQKMMGPNMVRSLTRWLGMPGCVEMVSFRTRWIDERVAAAVKGVGEDADINTGGRAAHLLILGAGYDTRGFRLDLWGNDKAITVDEEDDFKVIEVDQPEVQKKKLKNLDWLVRNDKINSQVVADRMSSNQVQFVPANFKADDLQQRLQTLDGFKLNQKSVVMLEAVSMYIPKESTAVTLRKAHNIVAKGSTLLITYGDSKYLPDTSADMKNSNSNGDTSQYQAQRNVLKWAAKKGEQWISVWSQDEFRTFLSECGFEVVSDTTQEDYVEEYLGAVGRTLEKDEVLSMERFVVARAV